MAQRPSRRVAGVFEGNQEGCLSNVIQLPAQEVVTLQEHLPAAVVAERLHRCTKWVIQRAKDGDFGAVFRDDGGWLIPASGVNSYLAKHKVITKAEGTT
jgi:hypothetical protein